MSWILWRKSRIRTQNQSFNPFLQEIKILHIVTKGISFDQSFGCWIGWLIDWWCWWWWFCEMLMHQVHWWPFCALVVVLEVKSAIVFFLALSCSSGESDGDTGGWEAGDQALGELEQGGWKRGEKVHIHAQTHTHRCTHIDAHTHMHTLIEDFSRCWVRKEASSGLVGMVDSSGGATAIFSIQINNSTNTQKHYKSTNTHKHYKTTNAQKHYKSTNTQTLQKYKYT